MQMQDLFGIFRFPAEHKIWEVRITIRFEYPQYDKAYEVDNRKEHTASKSE